MFDKNIIEKIKINSIGANKKEKYIKQQKKINRTFLIALITIILSTCTIACTNKINNNTINSNYSSSEYNTVWDEYVDFVSVDSYFDIYNKITYDFFTENNINFEEIKKGNVTVEDYRYIEDLSEDDLILYYRLLGKEECEKIVQVFNYKDWNDFLIKNNHIDKNGNPDFRLWLNEEYLNITQIMKGSMSK